MQLTTARGSHAADYLLLVGIPLCVLVEVLCAGSEPTVPPLVNGPWSLEVDRHTLSRRLCVDDQCENGPWTAMLTQSGAALTGSFSGDSTTRFSASISNDMLFLAEPIGQGPNHKTSCWGPACLCLAAGIAALPGRRTLPGSLEMKVLRTSNQVSIRAARRRRS